MTSKEKIFQFLSEHPDACYEDIMTVGGCSREVAYQYKYLWKKEHPDAGDELEFNYDAVNQEEIPPSKQQQLEDTIAELRKDLRESRRKEYSVQEIVDLIMDVKGYKPNPPAFQVDDSSESIDGLVPVAMWSDWHAGEVISASQTMGINEYDLDEFQKRAYLLAENTVDFCFNHMVGMQYPGIVICLLGDFHSGGIHQELKETDEPYMEALLRLFDSMAHAVDRLYWRFKRIHIIGVPGNHSRITEKVHAKNLVYNSTDWLLYRLLERYFKYKDNVTFQIPNGSDAQFSVYGHTFRATHGDQFRGGDSIIGSMGPVMRGDNKKRSWSYMSGFPYDTLLIGHFHYSIMSKHIMQNGSLCGINEYTLRLNCPRIEEPSQNLFFVHPNPDRGIVVRTPIFVKKKRITETRFPWVESK